MIRGHGLCFDKTCQGNRLAIRALAGCEKKWFDFDRNDMSRRLEVVSWSIILSMVVCEDRFADPNTTYVFDNNLGVFGGRTRLAMPKTRLHVGLIIIEVWFRGY